MTGGATAAGRDLLAALLRLPCGATLPNRLCKAAMIEGLERPVIEKVLMHLGLDRQGPVNFREAVIAVRRLLAVTVNSPGSLTADLGQQGPHIEF